MQTLNAQLTNLIANNTQTVERIIETFCNSGIITDLLMNIEYNILDGLIGDEMHELGIDELNDILVQHGHEAIEAALLLGELNTLMVQHNIDGIEQMCNKMAELMDN